MNMDDHLLNNLEFILKAADTVPLLEINYIENSALNYINEDEFNIIDGFVNEIDLSNIEFEKLFADEIVSFNDNKNINENDINLIYENSIGIHKEADDLTKITCFDLNSIMSFIESDHKIDDNLSIAYEEQNQVQQQQQQQVNSNIKRKNESIDDTECDSLLSVELISSPSSSSSSSSDDNICEIENMKHNHKRRRTSTSSSSFTDQNSNKKQSNKQAAIRYRQKKNKEKEELFQIRDQYEKDNTELKKKIDDIQMEINFVKNVLVEMLLKKNIFS